MKRSHLVIPSLVIFISIGSLSGQNANAQTQDNRPRPNAPDVLLPAPKPVPVRPRIDPGPITPNDATQPPAVIIGNKPEPQPQLVSPTATERHAETPTAASLLLPPSVVQARLAESQRMLRSRLQPMAMNQPVIDLVTLTALDRTTSRIHLVSLYKSTFLTKGAEATLTSSLGTPLSIRILRANGVNTAVAIFDNEGRSLVPLMVQYPIERNGVFREMAYYTSVHPALFSPELARSGQTYVRTMLDLAARRLRDKGVFISPQIVDVAERLCVVEHTDHDRFRLENRHALFQEIYSLFALNQLDTYRYSVSSAGAGGMVQMIPWAYNLMKQRHPGVGLIPDFVVGMRNHGNALQAMLLYMQDTWNDLAANEDVRYAMSAKLATQPELLAAGYNSNAARLPGYIRRGGGAWRSLIPRETQMYLQIYKSFEGLIPLQNRAR
jgi:hypothetical protein